MSAVNRLKFIFSADTREFQKQTNEGKKAVSEFANQGKSLLDKFASAFGINTRAIGDGIGSIGRSAAQVGTGFTAAAGGTNKLTVAMKLLKVAMASTGVGLLVVALGSLVAYFTKTQRGADKVKLVLESFKAIIAVLIDRIASFGEGLFKIFTGKFKEGAEQLRSAFKGMGEEIKTEAKEAWNLEKRFQALEDREISMMNVISAHRRKFDELRLASEDANNTIEQRMSLLQQASDEEKKAIKIEAELQKERVDIMRARVEMGESTRDELRELAEEEAKLNQIYERGASAQKELASQMRGLNKQLEEQKAKALEAQKALNQIAEASWTWGDVKMVDPEKLIPVETYREATKSLVDMYAEAGIAMRDISDEINGALESGAAGFGDWLGNMAAGTAGFKGLVALLGGTLADMAISLGRTAIGAGIAVKGIKQALTSLNPGVAITAGIALVALGTAIKSKLNAMASGSIGGGGGGMSASVAAGSTSYVYDNRVDIKPVPLLVTFKGELTARGRDLRTVINQEEVLVSRII